MEFHIALTNKEKSNPHKAVVDNRQSMSILERCFYRQKLGQIKEWDQLGVLEQAMSGKVPRVRRQYSKTLMDFFTSSRPYWKQDAERMEQRQAIFSRLWDLGAAVHTDHFDLWLHGCLGEPFAETLLSAGANPHHQVRIQGFGKTVVCTLMEGLYDIEEEDGPTAEAKRQALRRQVMLCLDCPGANQGNLDRYLGLAVRLGRGSIGKTGEWWDDLVLKLLEQGARPTMGDDGALREVLPHSNRNHDLMWLRRKLKQEGVELPQDNEGLDRIYRYWSWRERLKEARDSKRTLNRLLEHREAWMLHCERNGGEHFWEQMLLAPGGLVVGRKLLKAGVKAPWQQGGRSDHEKMYHPSSLLADEYSRHPHILRRFMRMVDPSTVDPHWAADARRKYLKSHCIPKFRRIKEAYTAQEIGWLMQALPDQSNGHHVSQEIASWMCDLPDMWKQFDASLEDRRKIVQLLRDRGLLAKYLVSTVDSLDFRSVLPVQVSFAKAWRQDPADAALIEECEEFAELWKILGGCLDMQSSNRQQVLAGVKSIMEVNPLFANALWDGALDALATKEGWVSMRRALWTLEGLRKSNWNLIATEEIKFVKEVVCQVDNGIGAGNQQLLVAWMKDAKIDFGVSVCAALELLSSQEAKNNASDALECLSPMVNAMIEHCADLSLLPEVEDPDRPLGLIIKIARDHSRLGASTVQPSSRQGSRRL